MKLKFPVIVLALGVVFIACTKSSGKPEGQSGPVTASNNAVLHRISLTMDKFNVGFERTPGSKEMPVKDYLAYFTYIVYDAAGKQIHRIEQGDLRGYEYMPLTGAISDSLPSGNYTVVLAGVNGDTSFRIVNPDNLATVQLKHDCYGYGVGDVFYKRIELKVSNDTALSNVNLERLVGKLEIHVTDAVFPANVYYVDTRVYNLSTTFNVSNETLQGVDTSYGGQFYAWAQPIITGTHFGSENKLQVAIRIYDGGFGLIQQKIIDSVVVYKNKRTVLSGKLFQDWGGARKTATVSAGDANTIYQNF